MGATLILMRHGESEWNKRNQFTGWVDVPLSTKGVDEAIAGGKLIRDIPIDIIFMSNLIRSQETAMRAMSQHSSGNIPVIFHIRGGKAEDWGKIDNPTAEASTIPCIKAWQLNERCYGALQGHNKDDARKKYGPEQVQIWRRSYDTPPPEGESLKMTAERTIPYFEETIVPLLKEGKNVFISAHGNSLRSIIMDLENLSKEEVVKLELPTGAPILYTYENGTFAKKTT